MFPSKAKAVAIFSPDYPDLCRAVFDGFDRYRRIASFAAKEVGVALRSRTQSTALQDIISQTADAIFSGHPRIRTANGWQAHYAFVNGEDYCFAFKRSVDGVPKNLPTTKQDRLREQGQLELKYGEPQWIIVMYTVDSAVTGIERVQLVSPKGYSTLNWEDTMYGAASGQTDLPFTSVAKPGRKTRIKSKSKVVRRKKAE